ARNQGGGAGRVISSSGASPGTGRTAASTRAATTGQNWQTRSTDSSGHHSQYDGCGESVASLISIADGSIRVCAAYFTEATAVLFTSSVTDVSSVDARARLVDAVPHGVGELSERIVGARIEAFQHLAVKALR